MVDTGRKGDCEEELIGGVMRCTEYGLTAQNAWYRCLSVFSF